MVKTDFLQRFNPITDDDWHTVEDGRIGILRLRAPAGSLDIAVVYLDTGAAAGAARISQMRSLSRALSAQAEALTVLIGDFNYVCKRNGRINKENAQWTGDLDSVNESEFERLLGVPFGLHEWDQEHFTCETVSSRSRIDRVYVNQHLSAQLDRHHSCSVLSWCKHLSAHRPLSFSRLRKSGHAEVDEYFPSALLSDPAWKRRVSLRYLELRRDDHLDDQPMRRLILLKRAMREVARAISTEALTQAAIDVGQIGLDDSLHSRCRGGTHELHAAMCDSLHAFSVAC